MIDDNDRDREIRDALQERHASPPFPADDVRAEIEHALAVGPPRRARPVRPWLRSALAVAAGLLVFVAGSEYGRRTARVAVAPDTTLSAPISIQAAGSEYVARLAELSDASGLTAAERAEAREVSLAILYAASVELLRESEGDQVLAVVARLLDSRRQAQRDPAQAGTLWF